MTALMRVCGHGAASTLPRFQTCQRLEMGLKLWRSSAVRWQFLRWFMALAGPSLAASLEEACMAGVASRL